MVDPTCSLATGGALAPRKGGSLSFSTSREIANELLVVIGAETRVELSRWRDSAGRIKPWLNSEL
jgi:hypothetical protein